MPIIEVNHVTKEYQLGQLQSLKTTVLNQWRRLTSQPVEEGGPFKALNEVTFSVEQGDMATTSPTRVKYSNCWPTLEINVRHYQA